MPWHIELHTALFILSIKTRIFYPDIYNQNASRWYSELPSCSHVAWKAVAVSPEGNRWHTQVGILWGEFSARVIYRGTGRIQSKWNLCSAPGSVTLILGLKGQRKSIVIRTEHREGLAERTSWQELRVCRKHSWPIITRQEAARIIITEALSSFLPVSSLGNPLAKPLLPLRSFQSGSGRVCVHLFEPQKIQYVGTRRHFHKMNESRP